MALPAEQEQLKLGLAASQT